MYLSQVTGSGVGVLGISKGGELGFAMASFLKNITAAVIINGSISNIGGNLQYKDETVPSVGINTKRVKRTKDGLKDIVDLLNNPLEGPDQKSLIPVERSDTAFLFLVGQDDHNWKSEFYAREASKRLQAHGKEKPQIICYPETGHHIEPPYFLTSGCVRLPCTAWWVVLSSGEGSPGLMPWPRWTLGSNSRLFSTIIWMAKRRQSQQNCDFYLRSLMLLSPEEASTVCVFLFYINVESFPPPTFFSAAGLIDKS